MARPQLIGIVTLAAEVVALIVHVKRIGVFPFYRQNNKWEALTQLDSCPEQGAAKQAQITELQKELALIVVAQTQLSQIASVDVVSIQSGLGMFDHIWAAIVSDVKQIITWV